MKTFKQLLSFGALALSSTLALAESTSGQTVSDELDVTFGFEKVHGKNLGEQDCTVEFIPGCGYSTIKITDPLATLEGTFSLNENVDLYKDEYKNYKVYFLNFINGKGNIGISRYRNGVVGIQIAVNGKIKSCNVQKN